MVFSSAIFLFIFFPVVFVLYRLVPGIRAKNIFLTLVSLVFYSFGQPQYLVLLLFSAAANYTAGRLIDGCQCGARRRAVMAAAAVLNVGMLVLFKYPDFIIENINNVLCASIPLPGIALPIGISFFTFQGMSYVIDVYRGSSPAAESFGRLLLYIAFFPQLVAGPIVKYHDIADMIESRQSTPVMTAEGLRRFIMGLSKKLLIADTLGGMADSVFSLGAAELDMRLAWLGAVCYTLQIYFDFSGYSDMAIGMGRAFGFRFLENFSYPYMASSIQEFWRRWHVSLSSWFRDYLYIPLGGSFCGRARANFNRLTVFAMTGLWHGASWNFVLWGLWHGMLLVCESSGLIPLKRLQKSRAGRALCHIYVLLAVVLGFTLFRAESLEAAGAMFAAMFGGIRYTPEISRLLCGLLTRSDVFFMLAGVLLCVDWLPRLKGMLGMPDCRQIDDGPGRVRNLQEDYRSIEGTGGRRAEAAELTSYAAALALLVYCVLRLSQAGFEPFIYFQF